MSLLASINNSLSGLGVAQRSIELLSNNVSNASNPAFVRETAAVTARFGGGVEVASVERYVDRFLAAKRIDARSESAAAETAAQTRQRLEDIVAGADEAARLDTFLAGFRADVARAAAAPSDPGLRRSLVTSADRLARRLNEMSGLLSELRAALDARYADLSGDLATRLDTLSSLNRTIVTTAYDKDALRTLEDRRDAVVTEIAELLPVTRFDRGSRDVALFAGQGRRLFDLETARVEARTGPEGTSLLLDGTVIDQEITGGELGALRGLRDDAIPAIQDGLDAIAGELSAAVNAAHAGGVSAAPRATWTAAYAFEEFQSIDLGATSVLLRDDGGRVVAQLGFATGTVVHDRTGLRDALAAKLDPDGIPYLSVSRADGRITIGINPASRARGLSLEVASHGDGPGLKQALHLDDVFVGAGGADSLAFDVRAAAAAGDPPRATLRVANTPDRIASLVGREIMIPGAIDGTVALRRVIAWDPATETATLDQDWSGPPPLAGTRLRAFLPSAATIALRPDLLSDPSRLATGMVDAASDLVGTIAGGAGDGRALERVAAGLDATRAIAGDPAGRSASLAALVRDQLAGTAGANADAQAGRAEAAAIEDALGQQFGSLSGVNVDEEMAQLILLQNAYAASARVLSTIGDLFQRLLQI
jgi:flagellar hook-associated protein 1 FlgK